VRIALVDYGAGNLPSVERAFAALGAQTVRCRSRDELAAADAAIVLPGVGHLGTLIGALDRQGLRALLLERIGSGVPFLGICVGMQALFASGDEAPGAAGLGVLPGRVAGLSPRVKLPHMGWNSCPPRAASRLLAGVEREWFYFAHSFAPPAEGAWVAATCDYGAGFAAVVERDNVMGVQFHPEKSGAAGRRVLANFLAAAA
jgi:glutamine amidotransferase